MAKLYPQTGPVTDAGKETSSSNATTHGGTSEKLIVACHRFDRPTVIQKILVSSKNGTAVTQMSPSTAAVQHETERAVHPPEQICRIFDFTDGVPPEYYAFTGSEHHDHCQLLRSAA